MTQSISIGHPPIEVRLRRNVRAKRMTLRISRIDSIATLTIPKRLSVREAEKFVSKQEVWLREQINKTPSRSKTTIGNEIPFLGEMHVIKPMKTRTAIIENRQIFASPGRSSAQIKALYISNAREKLLLAVEHYAHLLGETYSHITLRDTRSRWGSCSSEGRLMFSWRLIMAPSQVLDYVAAHEVAHLVEMNHSPAYWKIVSKIMPDYNTHRKWLRDNGAMLHSYDFSA